MRTLFFARHDTHFDITKATFFEKFMQSHFAEAQPVIGIKLTGFLKTVTEQMEHDDTAILFQEAMRGFDRSLRLDGVMQSLAQNGKFDTVLCNRWVLYHARQL